ncbi:MAG: DUF3419 family protein [Pseudomonadota bacterium]
MDAQLTALSSQISRTGKPGARVLFRTGGVADNLHGRCPDDILGKWHYDAKASKFAAKDDRSAIYWALHLYRKAT